MLLAETSGALGAPSSTDASDNIEHPLKIANAADKRIAGVKILNFFITPSSEKFFLRLKNINPEGINSRKVSL